LAAFLILPFLLSPITAKRKKGKAAWRPSKLEMKDGFIPTLNLIPNFKT